MSISRIDSQPQFQPPHDNFASARADSAEPASQFLGQDSVKDSSNSMGSDDSGASGGNNKLEEDIAQLVQSLVTLLQDQQSSQNTQSAQPQADCDHMSGNQKKSSNSKQTKKSHHKKSTSTKHHTQSGQHAAHKSHKPSPHNGQTTHQATSHPHHAQRHQQPSNSSNTQQPVTNSISQQANTANTQQPATNSNSHQANTANTQQPTTNSNSQQANTANTPQPATNSNSQQANQNAPATNQNSSATTQRTTNPVATNTNTPASGLDQQTGSISLGNASVRADKVGTNYISDSMLQDAKANGGQLKNESQYDSFIDKNAGTFGLDPAIVKREYRVESGGNQDHLGDTNRSADQGGPSMGLLQVTQGILAGGVWAHPGLETSGGTALTASDLQNNPEVQLLAGMQHLADYKNQAAASLGSGASPEAIYTQALGNYVGHDQSSYISKIENTSLS